MDAEVVERVWEILGRELAGPIPPLHVDGVVTVLRATIVERVDEDALAQPGREQRRAVVVDAPAWMRPFLEIAPLVPVASDATYRADACTLGMSAPMRERVRAVVARWAREADQAEPRVSLEVARETVAIGRLSDGAGGVLVGLTGERVLEWWGERSAAEVVSTLGTVLAVSGLAGLLAWAHAKSSEGALVAMGLALVVGLLVTGRALLTRHRPVPGPEDWIARGSGAAAIDVRVADDDTERETLMPPAARAAARR